MLLALFVATFVGYLLGSLPFGYLVARARGVNIFEVGSKNPGATNVRRVLGKGPSNLVFALDALKGAVATAIPWGYWLATKNHAAVASPGTAPVIDAPQYGFLAVAGLLGAFLGHSFSCFTKFRGGKGVATAAGGFAVLFPIGFLIALVVWLVSLFSTRYVSVASMLGAVSLPISAVATRQSRLLVVVCSLVAILVVLRHRANLARLAAGTENKIGSKPAQPKS